MNYSAPKVNSITITTSYRRPRPDDSAFVAEPIPEEAWTTATDALRRVVADKRPSRVAQR